MRFLSSLPLIFMVGLSLYAIWDLKINEYTPPVPTDQLAEKSPEIEAVMVAHREALRTDMSSNVLPQIEQSLKAITEEYGEASPEHNQALIETALMLNANARGDLAEEYMAKAVEVSREVYGTDHRETALNLNDLANLNTDALNQAYSEEAIGYLREAFEIRSKILPDDHPERLANEVNLADQLFLEWQAKGTKEDISALNEAGSLLSHVLAVYEAQGENANKADKIAVGLLFARVSFYRDDYETAAEYFSDRLAPVVPETDPSIYMVFTNSYAEYIVSLKKLGRDEEAEKMRSGIMAYLQGDEPAGDVEPAVAGVVQDTPLPAPDPKAASGAAEVSSEPEQSEPGENEQEAARAPTTVDTPEE